MVSCTVVYDYIYIHIMYTHIYLKRWKSKSWYMSKSVYYRPSRHLLTRAEEHPQNINGQIQRELGFHIKWNG